MGATPAHYHVSSAQVARLVRSSGTHPALTGQAACARLRLVLYQVDHLQQSQMFSIHNRLAQACVSPAVTVAAAAADELHSLCTSVRYFRQQCKRPLVGTELSG